MGNLWVVRGRDAFTALARDGRRAREGPLTVVFLAGPGNERTRVSFAIGRGVGPAVVRNRIRRRLRALMHEAAGDTASFPGPGDYLIVAAPASVSLSHGDLRAALRAALTRLGSAA